MRRTTLETRPSSTPESQDGNRSECKTDANHWKTILATHFVVFLSSLLYWSHVTTEIDSNWLRIGTASIQIVSAALFGRLSDTTTPQFALVASIVVALLGHMIEALATKEATIASILITSSSDPLLGGLIVLSFLTSQKDRLVHVGRLMMSYGIGMFSGPLIGHWLASQSRDHFLVVLSFLAYLCLLFPIAIKYLGSLSPNRTHASNSKVSDTAISLFLLLLVQFLTQFPLSALHSALPLVAKQRFGVDDSDDVRFVPALEHLLVAVTQGVLIGPIGRFSQQKIIRWSLIATGLAFFITIFIPNMVALYTCLTLILLPGTLFVIAVMSLLSKRQTSAGTALGLSASISALIQLLSPFGGPFLFDTFGYASFGVIGLTASIFGVISLRHAIAE